MSKLIEEMCDEDIMNLKNAEKFIFNNLKHNPQYEALEIFTIQDIIYRYENNNKLKKRGA